MVQEVTGQAEAAEFGSNLRCPRRLMMVTVGALNRSGYPEPERLRELEKQEQDWKLLPF